jgi:hypothetical protein
MRRLPEMAEHRPRSRESQDSRRISHLRPRANRRARQRDVCAFCSGTVQKVVQADISRLRRSNRSERL